MELLEKIKSQGDMLHRTAEVRSIDTEKREVELSFSSEEPYLRWFGWEVLSHEPGAMRMDRLKNNAPVLENHNWDVQVGAVKSAEIASDRKGRAVCKFSRGERGTEVLQDVEDGIRTNVSVGYIVHAAKKIGVKDGEEVILVTDWEPYEISIVSVPADITVGVGRSFENVENKPKEEKNIMPIEDENTPQAPAATKSAQPATVDPADIIKAERSRMAEIRKLGEAHNMGEMAQKAIDSGATADQFRTAVLEALEERSKQTVDETRAVGVVNPGAQVKKQFRSLGEQLQAVAAAEISGGRHMDERLLAQRAPSGMSEQVGADGGFLIQPEFAGELQKNLHEMGEILSRVKKVPISTNANNLILNGVDETSRQNGNRWGGVQVYRDHESGTVSASKPKFRKIELKMNKMTGLCYATEELLADASALGSIITQAFTEEFVFKNENEVIYGRGQGEMLGFFNSDVLISVAKESGQANDTFVVGNALKMWTRLYAPCRKNAVWLYNQELDAQLPLMTIGNQPVYLPAGGVSGNQYATLFGRPLIPVEYAQPLGDKGDIILADLSAYLYADKGGMEAAQSIHVKFVEGENTFRFTMRNDGQPMWAKPLTPAKGGATLSPFVTLDAR